MTVSEQADEHQNIRSETLLNHIKQYYKGKRKLHKNFFILYFRNTIEHNYFSCSLFFYIENPLSIKFFAS